MLSRWAWTGATSRTGWRRSESSGTLWYTATTVRRSANDRYRDQARHVASWIGTRTVVADFFGPRGIVGGDLYMPGEYPAVLVRNGSEEPVYDVSVRWGVDGKPREPLRYPLLPPNGEEAEIISADGETVEVSSLWFRDAAGRLWMRDSKGTLTPGTARPLPKILRPVRRFWLRNT
jgi:hypothetical protein